MRNLLLIAAVAAATFSVTTTTAQNGCNPNAPPAPLCNSPTQVTEIEEQCVTQQLVVADFQPCCNLQALEDTNGCPNTVNNRQCRFAEISEPACTDTGAAECRASQLTMEIETFQQTTTCCEQCSCYGDPHCNSFSGVSRSWFICDSRVQGKNGCHESRPKCESTMDPYGKPCIWQNPNNGPWDVAIKGAQCTYDKANSLQPDMVMYSFPQFLTQLYLGERGIIEAVQIAQRQNEKYFLTSDNCFATPNMPWRASLDANSPPKDPNWLPKSWTMVERDGDYIWRTNGIIGGVQLVIQCTQNRVRVNGEVRLGMTRLAVDIIDPIQGRADAAGFCQTGLFDIELETPGALRGTAKLQNTCQANQNNELMIAKEICAQSTTKQGVNACKRKFCQAARPDDVQQCVKDIKKHSWPKTFCAAYTTASRRPAACNGEQNCIRCIDDISDFGWQAAIVKYVENTVPPGPSLTECTPPQDLPADLIGCDRGILIQYQDANTKQWITYRAIREGQSVCTTGPGQFNQNDNPELFSNRLRFAQCGTPTGGDCPARECEPEMGFSARINYLIEPELNDLQEMVETDLLICNPEIYGQNSTACLDEKLPPLCPTVCRERC